MKYPNNINKTYQKTISYSNRGMDLESLLNQTNQYYLDIDKAVIYKKATPIGIVKMSYENSKKIIEKAYFKEPSTLDYNGIYKGRYLEFDAKECQSKTSFPLKNLHQHQLEHLKRIIAHQGIAFLIIYMNEKYFFLNGTDLIKYLAVNQAKSIRYEYIQNEGYELQYNYNKGLNYLDIIDQILIKENMQNEKD